MKVVLDTNVFVSSFLNPSGSSRAVIDLWKNGRIILCICAEILAEYIDVLGRFNIPPADLKDLLDLFRSRRCLEFVVITGELLVIAADPADDKFIECATVSKVRYLVSGDKHLLDLGSYGEIEVLKPAEFLHRYSHLPLPLPAVPGP